MLPFFLSKGGSKKKKVKVSLEFKFNTQENSTPIAIICILQTKAVQTLHSSALLNMKFPDLWVKSLTEIGTIHSAPPIMIQVDPTKPLLRINKYPINEETYRA